MSFWKNLGNNGRAVVIIAAIIALWMASGIFGSSDTKGSSEVETKPATNVAYTVIQGSKYVRHVSLMGRSEADAKVVLAAQVAGRIVEKSVENGDAVKVGDSILKIEKASRAENVAAAQAQVKSAEVLVKAARKLSTQGFKAASTLAEREAALANAKSALASAKLELERTNITSPVNGMIESVDVEVGDTVSIGQAVATVLGTEKFLIVGHASQVERGMIEAGSRATARLVDGKEVEGIVRFVAGDADEQTLTYRVEMVVDGTKYPIAAGMAAQLDLSGETIIAHKIPHSSLIIGDKGQLEVRVAEGDKAQTYEVKLLQDADDGIWVEGLPETANLIVRGHLAVMAGNEISATQIID